MGADTASSTEGSEPHPSRRRLELRERGSVKPLELFFDLVFVLGFTQCTALMSADPSWAGLGRGLLVLAVIWWAWVCYAWLTNLIEPEEGAVRLAMFGAMVGLLVVALCIPQAFGDRALPFAVAYAVVRVGHLALYFIAARERSGLRHWLLGYAGVTATVIALLVGASSTHGAAQAGLWMAAIAVDWGLPALSGVEHWQLVPAHFAERLRLDPVAVRRLLKWRFDPNRDSSSAAEEFLRDAFGLSQEEAERAVAKLNW